MTLSNFMRLLATILLLCGVYTETGFWTTLTLALVALGFEIHNGILKKILAPNDEDAAQ